MFFKMSSFVCGKYFTQLGSLVRLRMQFNICDHCCYQKYTVPVGKINVERHCRSFSRRDFAISKHFNIPNYSSLKEIHYSHPVMEIVPKGTNAQSGNCWKCGKDIKISSFFCDSCNHLQPVDQKADFFQILGILRSYRTEHSDLREKYRKLQATLHPDKFSSKSKKEQELSEEFSSVVNKAYSTLSNPLERGLYLLSLYNITIEEGSSDVDKMFLMEIMERNEEIENESDAQKLKEFYTKNKIQLDSLISKVAEAFDSNDKELAKKLLTKMKYYNSIEQKIKEIKQKLNIPD